MPFGLMAFLLQYKLVMFPVNRETWSSQMADYM